MYKIISDDKLHAIFAVIILVLVLAFIGLLPVIRMMVTGDFPGSSSFYGLQEDSPIVGILLYIRCLATCI